MAISKCIFEKEILTAAYISLHMIAPSLSGHATMRTQIMLAAIIAIFHQFIHLLIGYNFGKSMTPKLAGVEKFYAKIRYVKAYYVEKFYIKFYFIINSTRQHGISEPGFSYEQFVIGPLTFLVCSNKNCPFTIQGFRLDFFDQTNSK